MPDLTSLPAHLRQKNPPERTENSIGTVGRRPGAVKLRRFEAAYDPLYSFDGLLADLRPPDAIVRYEAVPRGHDHRR